MTHEHVSAAVPSTVPSRHRRRLALAALAATLGLAALAPAPASAGWWIEGIQGASCSPTNYVGETYWRRDGRRLRNTGTGPYEVFLASCPVSSLHDGWQPREYRIELRDSERRDTYCRVYDSRGTLLRTEWADWDRAYPVWHTIERPLGSSSGWVEITFECLLHPGASLERIEILWWQP